MTGAKAASLDAALASGAPTRSELVDVAVRGDHEHTVLDLRRDECDGAAQVRLLDADADDRALLARLHKRVGQLRDGVGLQHREFDASLAGVDDGHYPSSCGGDCPGRVT